MGEVYRARDLRLGREVAVKVVPEQLAQDPRRLARFEREAKAVAALAHPNILVLYDIGHDQGVPFAVTELLEGGTLRSRLAGGPVPWREALEVGAAVADGLAAAHAKGIIHRDVKPENLFVTADGRVKILDFGLASVEIPSSSEFETAPFTPCQTDPGTMIGTVEYMSPEQVRGLAVDAKSDLFSLGCVLFELMSGRRPFPGRTTAETAAAILHDEPPSLNDVAPHVPPEVESLIRHCLVKDPDQRISSARDLANHFRVLQSGGDSTALLPPTNAYRARPVRKRRETSLSLAVLPLANANADPDSEYLSDGMTESIINALSQLPGLKVMARSTAFRYKGRDVDAREVGRDLKVRAVLTGQLFHRDNRLILKLELVNVRDGTQLWGGHYDRDWSDVLAVEKAIAQDVADKLRIRLTGEQKRRLHQPATENVEAYKYYLKGRHYWNKRSAEALKKSIKFFEQAIDADPTYALAYSGVADAWLNLGGWGYLPFREAYPRAKAAAQRALALDDFLGEARVSLAMIHKEYDWDWPGAGREYERALEINPHYAVGHQWYGEYLAAIGRHADAIAAFQRAIELDPLSLIIHATLGRHGYYFARQYDQAIAQLKKTLEMDEEFWVARLWLGWTYANVGRHPEALAELQLAQRLESNLEILATIGYTYGRGGERAKAQQVLDQLQERSRSQFVSPMLSALVAIGMGEHEQALGWLEQAYDAGAQMLSELKAEPAFDPLRADPRFAGLMRRVGLLTAEPTG
jgi:serine/threonine protein kinase/tetratricopeptide (TPR) repeat protein